MKQDRIIYNTKKITISSGTAACDTDTEIVTKTDSDFFEKVAFIESASGFSSGDLKYTIALRNIDASEDVIEPCPKDLILNGTEGSNAPTSLNPKDRFNQIAPQPCKGNKYRVRITTPSTLTEDLVLYVTFAEVRKQS